MLSFKNLQLILTLILIFGIGIDVGTMNNTTFFQDETDSIAETEADREMKRERENEGDREGGAINLTSR